MRTSKHPEKETKSKPNGSARSAYGRRTPQQQQLLIGVCRVELTSTNLVGLNGHFETTVYTLQFHSGRQQTVSAGARGNLGSLPVTSVRRTSTKTAKKHTETNSNAPPSSRRRRRGWLSGWLAHTCSSSSSGSSSGGHGAAGERRQCAPATAAALPPSNERHCLHHSHSFIVSVTETPPVTYHVSLVAVSDLPRSLPTNAALKMRR